jgi:hypothetical protein
MSPQDCQKTGAKGVVSPKTPEQLMSSTQLEKNVSALVQSKSINGSGDKQLWCNGPSDV